MTLRVLVPSSELADDLSAGLGAEGAALPAEVELVVWDGKSAPLEGRLDIVVAPYMSEGDAYAHLHGRDIGLVQGQAIGYEGVAERMPRGVPFANASSVHETSTAELALALALAAQRELPYFVEAQERRRWEPVFADSLADRRVLLVGFGGVGKAIAARLRPFEVDIRAVARTAREEDGVPVHALDELPALLADTEILIASLPGGDETRHLLGAEALAALPDGALVVNVGRGPLIDTDALVAELEAGRLRAALDVTDPEPLPGDHPLWSAPGALIAPHVGGASSAMRPRIAGLVRRQIDRALAGEEPLNVVFGSD